MKIYFLYNREWDMILERGKGRLYGGYMSKKSAESQLEQRFRGCKDGRARQWNKGRYVTITKKDFEVVEVNLE